MIDKKLATKSRPHQTYYLADGTKVPGVTTVLSIIAKPALITWANKMGLNGIDTTKYVDAAGNAGTACHEMIEAHLKGIEFDRSSYAEDILDLAENGFLKYLDWEAQHKLEDIHSEMQLVSERFRFGGTADLYCKLDDIPTLIDIKTNATGIFQENLYQVAGYRILLEENGYPVERMVIIRVGKSDQPDLETKEVGEYMHYRKVFLAALNLYQILNEKEV